MYIYIYHAKVLHFDRETLFGQPVVYEFATLERPRESAPVRGQTMQPFHHLWRIQRMGLIPQTLNPSAWPNSPFSKLQADSGTVAVSWYTDENGCMEDCGLIGSIT